VEFFVISFFHETKIPIVDNFTLPSVGTRFKRLERKLLKGFSQDSLFLLPTFLG
jgi:hypothetical protein